GVYRSRAGGVLADEQREALRRMRFDAAPYDAIYCSPLGRCLDTARALRTDSWISDSQLAERDFGIFAGLTAEHCAARYPTEFSGFRRFDAEFRIPHGESRAEHLARTLDWVQSVADRTRVLAVTHGGTIDFLYRLGRGGGAHGGEQIFSA